MPLGQDGGGLRDYRNLRVVVGEASGEMRRTCGFVEVGREEVRFVLVRGVIGGGVVEEEVRGGERAVDDVRACLNRLHRDGVERVFAEVAEDACGDDRLADFRAGGREEDAADHGAAAGSATEATMSAVRSKSASVWASVRLKRRRAAPGGTEGGRTAATSTPRSNSASDKATAEALSPTMSGMICEESSGTSTPRSRNARRKLSARRNNSAPKSGDCAITSKRGDRAEGAGGGEAGREDETAGLVDEEIAEGMRAGGESAFPAERLGERSDDNVGLNAELRAETRALAVDADGVGFIDDEEGVVVAREMGEFFERGDVAVHAEERVGHDDASRVGGGSCAQHPLEVLRAVVAVDVRGGAGEAARVDDAGVVEGVGEDVVAVAGEGGEHTKVGLVSGGEDEGGFATGPARPAAARGASWIGRGGLP